MSKIQDVQNAQHRPDVATATPGDTIVGILRPLTGDQGASIPYGWKSRTRAVGMFPSAKNGCDMPFWDEFQLAFMRQAERAAMVEWYEARPTTMLGMLPFEYIPSFELGTGRGEMVVEISEPGMPTSDNEAWRVAEIRALLDGSDISFAQLTTYEVSRRKIFGRSRPLRPRTNDYWLRDNRAIAASFWGKFKSPWNTPA